MKQKQDGSLKKAIEYKDVKKSIYTINENEERLHIFFLKRKNLKRDR